MKTLKIRIALSVDKDGNWESCGDSKLTDDQKFDAISATYSLHGIRHNFWVDAYINIPDETITMPMISCAKQMDEKS